MHFFSVSENQSIKLFVERCPEIRVKYLLWSPPYACPHHSSCQSRQAGEILGLLSVLENMDLLPIGQRDVHSLLFLASRRRPWLRLIPLVSSVSVLVLWWANSTHTHVSLVMILLIVNQNTYSWGICKLRFDCIWQYPCQTLFLEVSGLAKLILLPPRQFIPLLDPLWLSWPLSTPLSVLSAHDLQKIQ